MVQQDLFDALRKRPFQPFSIHVSDGTVYQVHHPELVLVGPSTAMVFSPSAELPPPAFERYETVALSHIVRLIPTASPSTVTAD